MFRPLVVLFLSLTLSACELFPQRDEEKNTALHLKLLEELETLEQQGHFDPQNVNVVLINRYGKSFGGTVVLESAEDSDWQSAEDMVNTCLTRINGRALGNIKRCLRSTYPSEDRLRYSHGGIAFKFPGRNWQVVQSLRSRETEIHFQWYGTLLEFVDIPLVDHRIELIVPDLELQNSIAKKMLVEQAGNTLIDPDYNLVAKPFQTQEQMSNQFVLEMVAVALQDPERPNTRINAQLYLREQGYRPSVILLGGFQTLTKWDQFFGTIDLSDQLYAREFEVGEMITILSIRQLLQKLGRVSIVQEVRL